MRKSAAEEQKREAALGHKYFDQIDGFPWPWRWFHNKELDRKSKLHFGNADAAQRRKLQLDGEITDFEIQFRKEAEKQPKF